MNPITREESLLDGQDLTPITRKEQFIKRIYDKTQEIPEPITREEYFLKKAGEGTSPIAIEQLNVTENGTYSEAGKAYSPVIVDVPVPTLITKTITENGTYTASEDNADGYSQVTVNVPYMEKKSASGDIASFSDGAGYPFLKVKANINPVQDLHGQDYPWVGGAGKNKINAPDITLADAGDIYNGAINLAAGTYTLSSSNTTTSVTVEGVSRTMPLTFTLANAITTIQITASGAGEFKNIQIESGSSATTFAPYSNICPISGFTGADVAVTGVNVWDEQLEEGTIDTTSGQNTPNSDFLRAKNYISVYPNKTYFYKAPVETNYARIYQYDENKNLVKYDGTSSWLNSTFTVTDKTHFIRFVLYKPAYGTTYNHDISINYPSTDISYRAYNGHVYPISWHDEAGIVYGGYIDLVSGVLVKIMGEVDLSSLSWTRTTFYTNPFFYCNVSDRKQGENNNFLCSAFKKETVYNTSAGAFGGNAENGSIAFNSSVGNSVQAFVRDDVYTDATTFANAMSGQKLVYELATPQTYQLTPQQINTLIGQNNVWNNTNGQTEVEYFIPIE